MKTAIIQKSFWEQTFKNLDDRYISSHFTDERTEAEKQQGFSAKQKHW